MVEALLDGSHEGTPFEIVATEALLASTAGYLCEGTGTNVFVVLDHE